MTQYKISMHFTKLETEALHDFVHACIRPENKKDDPNLKNSLEILLDELVDAKKYYGWTDIKT